MRTTLILLTLFCCSHLNAFSLPQIPIKSYDCDTCESLPHETLQARWKINENPLTGTKRNIHKSYSYTKQVTATQLQQGISLAIHSPEAVIRIIPLEKTNLFLLWNSKLLLAIS